MPAKKKVTPATIQVPETKPAAKKPAAKKPAKAPVAKAPVAKAPAKKPAAKKPAVKKVAAAKPAAKAPVKAAAKPAAAKKTPAKKAVVADHPLAAILEGFKKGGTKRSARLDGNVTDAQKEILNAEAAKLGVSPATLNAAIITAWLSGLK